MFSFMANTLGHFYKNFQGFTYCSVFKVRVVVFATAILLYHGVSLLSTTFLTFFECFFAFNQSLAEKEGFEPSRRFPDLHP